MTTNTVIRQALPIEDRSRDILNGYTTSSTLDRLLGRRPEVGIVFVDIEASS